MRKAFEIISKSAFIFFIFINCAVEIETPKDKNTVIGNFEILEPDSSLKVVSVEQSKPEIIIRVQYTGQDTIELRWEVIDPDDPANDIYIDPNGDSGNDNFPNYDNPPNIDSLIFPSEPIVLLPEQTALCTLKIIGKRWLNFYRFNGGDNYKVRAVSFKNNNPKGDTAISASITLWKKMEIEYDHSPQTSLNFSAMDDAFKKEENANRNTYLYYEVRENEVSGEFWVWIVNDNFTLHSFFQQHFANLEPLFIAGISGFLDSNLNPIWNLAGRTPTYEWLLSQGYDLYAYATGISWSFIGVEVIDSIGGDVQKNIAKTVVHELGHQLANLSEGSWQDHSDSTCVMWQGFASYLIEEPHFCGICIEKLRKLPILNLTPF